MLAGLVMRGRAPTVAAGAAAAETSSAAEAAEATHRTVLGSAGCSASWSGRGLLRGRPRPTPPAQSLAHPRAPLPRRSPSRSLSAPLGRLPRSRKIVAAEQALVQRGQVRRGVDDAGTADVEGAEAGCGQRRRAHVPPAPRRRTTAVLNALPPAYPASAGRSRRAGGPELRSRCDAAQIASSPRASARQ